jgi:hypothetical protein
MEDIFVQFSWVLFLEGIFIRNSLKRKTSSKSDEKQGQCKAWRIPSKPY